MYVPRRLGSWEVYMCAQVGFGFKLISMGSLCSGLVHKCLSAGHSEFTVWIQFANVG